MRKSYGFGTSNGPAQSRKCFSKKPLMLTDVVMPMMGGRELEEHLRPLRSDIKVIYMSEYTDNAIVHHGVLSPEIEFLGKPFTPASLRKKVREVLDQ